jgi:hypothetical protein
MWFNSALTDAQMTSLNTYLSTKYNATTPQLSMTPPIAPYLHLNISDFAFQQPANQLIVSTSQNNLYRCNGAGRTIPLAATQDTATVLLLHCEGANNDTTFSDSGYYSIPLVNSGGAVTSTTSYKFGSSSFYTNGTTGYKYLQMNSSYLTFGTSAFTIEFWINPSAPTTQQRIMGNLSRSIGYSSGNWAFGFKSVNTGRIDIDIFNIGSLTCTTTMVAGTWYHVALVRNGSNWWLYKDGVREATATSSVSFDNGVTRDVYIGWSGANLTSTTEYFNGYLDEIRITRSALYTTTPFTVPTNAFSNPPLSAPQLSINYGQSAEYSDWIVKEVLVYNTNLSLSSITSIEAMLMRKNMGALDIVSTTTKNNCVAAYSLKLLTMSYTGPVLRVKRASDNVEKDFYANIYGDIGDEYLGRGANVFEWLKDASGNVTILYDQSGYGRNMLADANTGATIVRKYKMPNIQCTKGKGLRIATHPIVQTANDRISYFAHAAAEFVGLGNQLWIDLQYLYFDGGNTGVGYHGNYSAPLGFGTHVNSHTTNFSTGAYGKNEMHSLILNTINDTSGNMFEGYINNIKATRANMVANANYIHNNTIPRFLGSFDGVLNTFMIFRSEWLQPPDRATLFAQFPRIK